MVLLLRCNSASAVHWAEFWGLGMDMTLSTTTLPKAVLIRATNLRRTYGLGKTIRN